MKGYDPMKIFATLLTLFALVFFQFVASASEPSKVGERDMVYATLEEVERMIEEGADINSDDSYGMSLVSSVVLMRGTETLKGWIELGADINRVDKNGSTPLSWAVAVSDVASVNLLIQHGAKLNHKKKNGDTPLHVAIKGLRVVHSQIAIDLIKAGADVNALDGKGNSPLNVVRQIKAFKGFKTVGQNIEKILIEHGAHDISTFSSASSRKNSKHRSNQTNNSHQNSNDQTRRRNNNGCGNEWGKSDQRARERCENEENYNAIK